MRDSIQEAWENGGKTPDDPGLRECYAEIPRAPIRLVVLPLGKAVNHGGMTRIADAYRIERVDLSREGDNAIDFSGQRGTKGWQPWRWVDPVEAIEEAKAGGYTLAALTLSERAVDVAHAPWTYPLAILVGEENGGIPDELERQCDFSIAIPLYGLVTSLNVVTATAIALDHALRDYGKTHEDFQPVRRGSRRLVGMEPTDYSANS